MPHRPFRSLTTKPFLLARLQHLDLPGASHDQRPTENLAWVQLIAVMQCSPIGHARAPLAPPLSLTHSDQRT